MHIRNAERELLEGILLGRGVPYDDPTMYRLFFKVKNNRAPHSSNVMIRPGDDFSISNNHGELLLYSNEPIVVLNVPEVVEVLDYLSSIAQNFNFIPIEELDLWVFPDGLTFKNRSIELTITESYSFILSFARELSRHDFFDTIFQKLNKESKKLIEKGSELCRGAKKFRTWEG